MNSSKLAVISVTLLILKQLAMAEPPPGGNPFGNVPPLPPGADYQEDEDFLDPGNNNFGANTPNPAIPPAPGTPLPSHQPPTDRLGTSPQQPATRLTQPSAPAPQTNTAATNATPGSNKNSGIGSSKPSPKLADYLDLDNSIKGLEVKNFDLPDKDIKDVVTLISKWTGKNFILDSKVRGKITVLGPAQVSLQEAYQAFLSALEANGLTTVQAGKYIRIIESAEARRAPVKTYTGDYAPKDDQFITRIIQLKFINADEVQKEFRDLVTRQGKLFAYEPTNSLIITDTGSNIQRIKDILDAMDVKSFETNLQILKIKNNSAKAVSDMLGEIYGDDKSKSGASRSFRKSALERMRGGGVITKIIPDETTNSLLVLANQAGFAQLKLLVERLDVKSANSGRIRVYYCEYAKAEDLASTLGSLSGGGGKSRSSKSSSTSGGTSSTPSTGSSGPVTAELEGGVKITADPSTNALVITASSADYQTIKKVIKKLDIPRLQVYVETAILEISVSDLTKLGSSIAAGAPGRGFAGGYIGDSDTLKATVTSGLPLPGATIPIFLGPSFGAKAAGQDITVNSFMGLINLLTSTTNTSILSTPQILALDNEKAEFKVLDEIPVQSSFTNTSANGATGTVENKKVGITLKLTPHINAASNSIRLDIEQKVDTFKANNKVPEALKNYSVATTSRETNTAAVVKDGDYIMLGGLMSDQVDESVTKVPLLGDIPVIGWLFKSKSTTVEKKNLVVLMRPKIIRTAVNSADLVRDSLSKRKTFVEKSNGGDEPLQDTIDEVNVNLDRQEERAKMEEQFEYRNNSEDDSIDPDDEKQKAEKAEKKAALDAKKAEQKAESKPEEKPLLEPKKPEPVPEPKQEEVKESVLGLPPDEPNPEVSKKEELSDPFALPEDQN